MAAWPDLLFSRVALPKGKRKGTVVMAPVAGRKQAGGLLRLLGRQSFKDYDVLLIFPQGRMDAQKSRAEGGAGQSRAGPWRGALMMAEEKGELGTSGCFFAGQALCHHLGYEVIVAADHDAELSSPNALGRLVEEARKSGKLCVLPSCEPGRKPSGDYFVANQYGAYPRSAMEEGGLITPYMWRGGEDWEIAGRYSSRHLLQVCGFGHSVHPRAGSTIYHKMAGRGKYYPYACGLMRAMLFLGGAKGTAMFLLWHAYQKFFAFAFGDPWLARASREASRLRLLRGVPAGSKVAVHDSGKPRHAGGAAKAIREIAAIPLLALGGRARLLGCEVSYSGGRLALLARTAVGIVLAPLFALEGVLRLLEWQSERRKVAYPVFPEDLARAAADYAKMAKEGSL